MQRGRAERALANRKDDYHERAKRRLSELHEPIITTWPVMTETCYLLARRLGRVAAMRFMASYTSGAFDVFELTRLVSHTI